MNLEVRSETRLSFEIDYGRDTYLLDARGGTWELRNSRGGDFYRNIGSVKRLAWMAALTRSLTEIGAFNLDRDGV